MEMTSTPEQQFMMMLQERISTLEDEMLHLERQVQKSKASQYHKLDLQIPLLDGESVQPKIEIALNAIFHHRKKMEPVFAAWTWHSSGHKLFVTMVLTTRFPITEEQMKTYLDAPYLSYSSLHDLYTFIQYFNYYYHDEDEGDTLYNYEYWHSHYGYLYDFTDYELTDEPFTQSKNYHPSKELQSHLRKWIFHSQKNWMDLLRIFV